MIAEHRLEEAGDRAERGDVVGLVATGGPALRPALAERLLHSAVRTVRDAGIHAHARIQSAFRSQQHSATQRAHHIRQRSNTHYNFVQRIDADQEYACARIVSIFLRDSIVAGCGLYIYIYRLHVQAVLCGRGAVAATMQYSP